MIDDIGSEIPLCSNNNHDIQNSITFSNINTQTVMKNKNNESQLKVKLYL